MRTSPRSMLAALAAAVVAILTMGIVWSDLSTLHRRAGSLGTPRSVLVARQDVPLGTTLSANDVQIVTRYGSTVPADAVRDVDAAIGRVVVVPLVEASVVQVPHLSPAERDGMDGLVPEGRRAVRLRPDDGLEPPAGAVVDVFAALDTAIDAKPEARRVARAARVLAVDDAPDGDGNSSGVTLLVTEDEARGLAFATANGVVTLALAPPEDACC
jgi:Flp pilus assembly protein CpaB